VKGAPTAGKTYIVKMTVSNLGNAKGGKMKKTRGGDGSKGGKRDRGYFSESPSKIKGELLNMVTHQKSPCSKPT